MEALSPTFVPAKPNAPAAVVKGQTGPNQNAPDLALPLRFMVTGVLALVAAVAIMIARPDILATYHYNQYVIAVTHLLVLGWISTIVMGAIYQLVPVALETRLYSERLARWQFVFHSVGFAGMVWMFWSWNMKQVGHFGCALAVGVGLFVYNLARTLWRVPRWNVVAAAVAAALAWLSLTVLAGLTLAAGKCTYESASVLAPTNPLGALVRALREAAAVPTHYDQISAMHAHAHLGVIGVFLMLIVGVSYKLVPMFTLSELQSVRRAWASLVFLNLGLVGSFLAILLRSPWRPVCTLVVIAGLILYGVEMVAILRARKRASLDWGLKYFLTALSLLVPLIALGVVLSWPGLPLTAFTGQLENAYGFLALLGVVSLAILGMLFKILPFLVWYASYSRQIGLSKVPALADLYSAELQQLGYWSYLAGLGTTTLGIVLGNAFVARCGCVGLAISLSFLLVNVANILSHLARPRVQPIILRPALKTNS
jgi:hypothetical protein